MLWASLFAFLVALGSMATSTILNDIDQHTASHVVSVLWLMAAMGLIAWMKVKVSHPQFGSVSLHLVESSPWLMCLLLQACSMVALIL